MALFCNRERLILASGSPRRRDFLSDLGLEFETVVNEVDESQQPDEQPEDFVARLARTKALTIDEPGAWILAADTAVVMDGQILGKPRNADEACAMLLRLSGRWHEVWTGVALRRGKPEFCRVIAVCSRVRFIDLDTDLCQAYVRTGEPMDKAGAYGIQGKGCFLAAEIRGSYTNVVGLPMSELLAVLLENKVIMLRNS